MVDTLTELSNLLWEHLPPHVTRLDMGEEVLVEQPNLERSLIPLAQRKTWDLKMLDSYAQRTAQSIGMDYKSPLEQN